MVPENHNYLQTNRESWNRRTHLHIDSDFYEMPAFLDGKSSLKTIELDLLGKVQGKSILHLQCHFGQDTLSLARLGAHVTGMDLSDAAIDKARELNKQLGLDARFVCCDLYSLPDYLGGQFDLVFTSYGTIGWLPDLSKWANIVAKYLKPGGKFVFVEFHPVVWMFDDDFEGVKYKYSDHQPIIESTPGSYAAKEAEELIDSVNWNHGIADVIQNLLNAGLQIDHFGEYDYSPYDCFNKTIKIGESKYRIKHLGDKIPMVYSLTAKKA